MHTRAGQVLGRDLLQWWRGGARVTPEVVGVDHRYRDALVGWCERTAQARRGEPSEP